MGRDRLDLLFLSPFPPSPATFGAQRRLEGLMTALARSHRVSLVSLIGPGFDVRGAETAAAAYCDQVTLVPWQTERGVRKRLFQARTLVSSQSFERAHFSSGNLQVALDDLLQRRPFDFVCVEFPFMSHYQVRQAPPGVRRPQVILDQHNIEHDLARQSGLASSGPLRRLYHQLNWRKILREELAAWTSSDGVAFTSSDDRARALALTPGLRSAVIPNAVDVEYFRPRPDLPKPDGRTVVFFGTLNYFPNQDGVRWFLAQIWPRLAISHPRARLKIIGPHPTAEVLAQRSPNIEVAGLVDDLRPHLAEAAAIVVPLRVGGGTRFKILEAMAMGKPIVSTALGAEGIGARPEREILLADSPDAFAASVQRLLDDPGLGQSLGHAARAFVGRNFSWSAVGVDFERFLGEVSSHRASPRASTP